MGPDTWHAVTLRGGDLGDAGDFEEPVDPSGARMTGDSGEPARQDGGRNLSLPRQADVPDRVHTTMHWVKMPRGEPPLDHPPRETEQVELLATDDAVLSAGHCREHPIRMEFTGGPVT